MASILLKPGREKSVLRRHPWVFSGAVGRVKGNPAPGDWVSVLDSRGRFLAWGTYSPGSQIRVRLWAWDEGALLTPDLLRERIQAAYARRQAWIDPQATDAYRVVFGESDGLPGLIVDRYADTLVVQFLSVGVDRWREVIADLLFDLPGVKRVYERSDAEVRRLEGLEPRVGLLRGEDLSERLQIRESGLSFWVDVRQGHKTGFYLDQRPNRRLAGRLAAGRRVLNAFAYTGGFAVYALAGGAANVVNVEASASALALGQENLALNRLPAERTEWIQGDVFQVLREFHRRGRRFDLVILDPPKFAATASQVPRAARGYKDINRLAFLLLEPGGVLMTFSCSGGLDAALFQKIVADAALDAGVEARIVARLTQGPDHPVLLSYPEAAYLKGLVVTVG